jgi:glycosyltransferase involved in cell wall biosynthesis
MPMGSYQITAHVLVRNEDQFLRFALESALPLVSAYLIYDTGSTDRTLEILKNYRFEEKGPQDPSGITRLRNEMIAKTKTDWFFLLDGDEVWNRQMLADYLEFTLKQPRQILATFLRTRNCVGDIYHYRDDSSGRYEIAGRKGHLNARAYRREVVWRGQYPLEGCVDSRDARRLAFFEGYYWHLTHLRRSSSAEAVMGFRRPVLDLGLEAKTEELPEVLRGQNFPRRSKIYEAAAVLAGAARKFL